MLQYLFWAFLFISCLPVYASHSLSFKEKSIDGGISYRTDSFSWSIARPGIQLTSSDLASVKWDSLSIFQIEGQLKFLSETDVYGRLNADFGWLMNGHFKQWDAFNTGVGSQHLTSSIGKTNKSQVYDLSAGLGYQFRWFEDRLQVSPMLGYSYHSQHLPMLEQAGSSRLSGLFTNPMFQSRWYGPWLGIDLAYPIFCRFALFASFERHWSFYRASGHWGIVREDLLSPRFSQHANARGYLFSLGGRYIFSDCWFVNICGRYDVWRTRIGSYMTEVIGDDGLPTKGSQPLNHVKWQSWTADLSLGRYF